MSILDCYLDKRYILRTIEAMTVIRCMEAGLKLAEALVLRADIQKRIEQLKARLIQSAKAQEGDTPPEDPQVLLREINQLLIRLEALIPRINRINLQTTLPDGTTLTDAREETFYRFGKALSIR